MKSAFLRVELAVNEVGIPSLGTRDTGAGTPRAAPCGAMVANVEVEALRASEIDAVSWLISE